MYKLIILNMFLICSGCFQNGGHLLHTSENFHCDEQSIKESIEAYKVSKAASELVVQTIEEFKALCQN